MLVLGGDRIKRLARFDLPTCMTANFHGTELILSSGFRVLSRQAALKKTSEGRRVPW